MDTVELNNADLTELLYRDYNTNLKKKFYKFTKSYQTAEDLLQDVFIRFYITYNSNEGKPVTHLFNIINSTIAEYIRNKTSYRWKTRKPEIISIESTLNFSLFINSIPCPKNDSEINSIDNSDFYLLFNCLSERQKQVITLYYSEELTFNEIGKVLGLHESTVYSYNVKALLKLKNFMESENYAQYSINWQHWNNK